MLVTCECGELFLWDDKLSVMITYDVYLSIINEIIVCCPFCGRRIKVPYVYLNDKERAEVNRLVYFDDKD